MKGKNITTLIAILAGIGVCAWVFWPESDKPREQNSTVLAKTSGQEPLDSFSPEKNLVKDQESKQAIDRGENLPALDKKYTMKKKEEHSDDEFATITAIQNAADSAISMPAIRAEVAPRAEKMILNALKKYNNPFLHAVYADLLFNTAREKEAVKQYALAYPQLGRIPEFRVNYSKAIMKVGAVNFSNGDFIGAIANYETVLKLNPQTLGIDSSLYKSYTSQIFLDLELMNLESTERYIKNCLNIEKDKFLINFYAGAYYAKEAINQPKKAIIYFEKCKEIAPMHANTRQMLYNLYLAQGDTVLAKRQLVK
ncbi:MAG: hypothetical protein KDC92_06735 [Bacteroidetes bacterium]|nr:hypothetical protein [Bacteroidota bacterium]